jgi:hypothetical protein
LLRWFVPPLQPPKKIAGLVTNCGASRETRCRNPLTQRRQEGSSPRHEPWSLAFTRLKISSGVFFFCHQRVCVGLFLFLFWFLTDLGIFIEWVSSSSLFFCRVCVSVLLLSLFVVCAHAFFSSGESGELDGRRADRTDGRTDKVVVLLLKVGGWFPLRVGGGVAWFCRCFLRGVFCYF